ncbi:hypothetical protein G9F72_003695 [Clostridium estertheticum]|uniref:putative immunity protein n=1 Tax=Clostridium estertheticum TaxID=238834 RepID=UPI0013E98394|nr:hypothetical protein [Clostridium estertheticum]MBZ9685455.1 hypothetical protein [Clostridium estertheticum]
MKKISFSDKKIDSDIKKEIAELTVKMDHRTLAIWATDCAEHVLSYFEDKYPDDNRPREAIEAGRAWVRGEISVSEARCAAFTAHASARDADEGEARAVARAAGHAAATAHVAGHAVHAANYAATAIAKERDWQYQHLLDLRGNSN